MQSTREESLTCEEQLEAAEDRITELETALRKEITFRTATEINKDGKGRQIWLPTMDVISIFHKTYTLRNQALANNKPNTKLIFTIQNDGRIIDVHAVLSEEDYKA